MYLLSKVVAQLKEYKKPSSANWQQIFSEGMKERGIDEPEQFYDEFGGEMIKFLLDGDWILNYASRPDDVDYAEVDGFEGGAVTVRYTDGTEEGFDEDYIYNKMAADPNFYVILDNFVERNEAIERYLEGPATIVKPPTHQQSFSHDYWRKLFSNTKFSDFSDEFLTTHLNWIGWGVFIQEYTDEISEDFLRKYKDNKMDWGEASFKIKMSEDFIREMQDYVCWHNILVEQDLSEDFIWEFREIMDDDMGATMSSVVSDSQDVSEEFVDKLREDSIQRHRQKRKNKV